MATTSNLAQTIPLGFVATVAEHGERIALRERQSDGTYREWTYAQYAEQVARCAAGLRALGFGPGQRLVLMLRNRPEFHVLDMAAYFCGGTAVSIYNSSSAAQVKYLVEHSEATFAVADDDALLERFLAHRAEQTALKQLGVLGSSAPAGGFCWQQLLDHAALDLAREAETAQPDDLATLIYTSGTTGAPKAVMISHRNVVASVRGLLLLFDGHPIFGRGFAGKRAISYLPMAHVAERSLSQYAPAFLGHEITCCPDATQLALYLRAVRPQLLFGVPRVWEKLQAGVLAAVSGEIEHARQLNEAISVALPLADKIHGGHASEQERAAYQRLDAAAFEKLRNHLGFDDLQLAMTGASPMPRALQLWFRAIGVPISDIYGMSECCGAMTWSPTDTKPGTVGKAYPGLEVKLADDGEILCRGENVFSAYLKADAATAAALDDEGWLHSGDIGKLDPDGYFVIVDRKKELIITSAGENVSPANLEAALKNIPLVGQACAIGDNRPFVSALIVLDPDVAQAWARRRGLSATLAALAVNAELIAEVEAGLEQVMADFNRAERVKRITILGTDWLPDSEELTPTSKVKRRAIDAKYAAEIEALYATTLAPPSQVARAASKVGASG